MDPADRFRYLLEYLLARAFFGALGRLPAPLGPALGRGLGRAVGAFLRSRSRRAEENLRLAFPGAAPGQLRAWVRRVWSNLGEALWEFSCLPWLTPASYYRRVDVEGMERLWASHGAGKGVIFFAAHLTNWEWTSLFVAFAGIPMGAVARRMKNPYFDDFLTRTRSMHGVRLFPHRNAVREGLKWLKGGGCLGVLVDQRITAGGASVPFFGRPALTTTMPALLAQRTGAAVHGVSARREGGRLKITVHPVFDLSPFGGDAAAATAAMTAEVERWVRADPPFWLWIHDRWKT